MKKVLIITTLFILLVSIFATTVKAVSASTLPEDLYNLGKKYKMTNADKVRGERYIKDNPITDEQAEIIYAKAEEAVKVLEEAGVTDVKKLETQLNRDQKKRFRNLCQEGADVLGVFLVYKNGAVEVYKEGKLIDVYPFIDNDKLSYTGNNIKIILVASTTAVILSIAIALIIRRKSLNA